jgi:nitric oxide reductase subunit B
MFGWAHHTYLLPTYPWIRYVAYGISMTEWIVLASLILSWRNSLKQPKKETYPMAYRFLMATDFWLFLNLILALLFSIPAINFFTHGTHVTVAHAMGTTIGINTTILISGLLFIAKKVYPDFNSRGYFIRKGFWVFNISLFIFWCSLLTAGIKKSYWMYVVKEGLFSEMQEGLTWVYIAVFISGIGLFISISMVVLPLLRFFISSVRLQKPRQKYSLLLLRNFFRKG